jgi:hypothetical protein
MFSGLCNPNCVTDVLAIEINIKDGSIHIELVGKGHIENRIIASTTNGE